MKASECHLTVEENFHYPEVTFIIRTPAGYSVEVTVDKETWETKSSIMGGDMKGGG